MFSVNAHLPRVKLHGVAYDRCSATTRWRTSTERADYPRYLCYGVACMWTDAGRGVESCCFCFVLLVISHVFVMRCFCFGGGGGGVFVVVAWLLFLLLFSPSLSKNQPRYWDCRVAQSKVPFKRASCLGKKTERSRGRWIAFRRKVPKEKSRNIKQT